MGSTSAANKLTSRHPLQRLPSPSPTISALIHLIGLASFSLSYKYLFDFPTFINSSYGWHFQYLTIIGLTLAFLTFVFGFLADITLSPRLFLIKNSLSLSILLTIDLLFLSPPWTINALPAMGLSSTLAVAYWAWVEQCYKYNGFYPYPLFGHLDTTQRAILFTGAALTMTGSTAVLKWLYGRVNGLQGAQYRSSPNNIKGR
ncbi:integral membrane protein [Botrytis cinerea]